jgi:hypothetical protein
MKARAKNDNEDPVSTMEGTEVEVARDVLKMLRRVIGSTQLKIKKEYEMEVKKCKIAKKGENKPRRGICNRGGESCQRKKIHAIR